MQLIRLAQLSKAGARHGLVMQATRNMTTLRERCCSSMASRKLFFDFDSSRGESIQSLREPSDYYDTLLSLSSQAKRRIGIASLYVGVGTREKALLDTILTRMQTQQLETRLLLDYTRSTRGTPSTCDLILPLTQAGAVTRLFHTPRLRGAAKKILRSPFNEIVGLQHMKIYVFDDHVLLSGANLQEDYFTNRVDRYVLFKHQKLADFCMDLIATVQEFSLHVSKEGVVSAPDDLDPTESNYLLFCQTAQRKLQALIERHAHPKNAENSCFGQTRVYPLVQMGLFDLHDDELTAPQLLSSMTESDMLTLATGYFNLSHTYRDALLAIKGSASLLCASPQANGFLNAKGVKGYIPDAYTHLQATFLDDVAARKLSSIMLHEYEREGWTFHAKALFLQEKGARGPCIATIGSSNFGDRSASRDLELQMVIATDDPALQQQFAGEIERLLHHARAVSLQTYRESDRRVSGWVKGVAKYFKSYF